MNTPITLPTEINQVLNSLQAAGYEAHVVGGSVRDSLMQRDPKDWDVTTNALPDQIQQVFPNSLYLNNFGTVTVRSGKFEVEVTTYRFDGEYEDYRHPTQVQFGASLEEDVIRRDFTINALAYNGQQVVDHCDGQADIDAKLIRAVGNPEQRFKEDALRMLRAIRFASQLGFAIEPATYQAIAKQNALITHVSGERVRDELVKMLKTNDVFTAMWHLQTTGLMDHILPEISEGVGVEQNLHHIYTVWFHNVAAAQFCPSDDWRVRLAALLHDVGKPRVKQGTGKHATFHQHEHVGAKMTRKIMRRLAFSKQDVKYVTHLVRHHMFYYNTGEITDAGVRRFVQRVGLEHIDALMAVRIADRMGSGVYKEKPYKLVELEKRIAYVQQDPTSTSQLVIDGDDIMKHCNMKPGAQVGVVLHRLLDEVLEDPAKNTVEYLSERAAELAPDIAKLPNDEARTIMKQYREALSEVNAFKG